jgi:hypothetical protein
MVYQLKNFMFGMLYSVGHLREMLILMKKKKITQWSDQEIDRFKKTLNPFIPFIRFFQISGNNILIMFMILVKFYQKSFRISYLNII